MVRPTVITLAKRVPLIQFRKGGGGSGGSVSAKPSVQASPTKGGNKMSGPPAIEHHELPARFARMPISPLEAEYINNGGIPN